MTAYIVRESNSMKLGLTTSFPTLEEAEQAKQTLDSLNGFEYSLYTIETLEHYGLEAQKQLLQFKAEEARCAVLEEAITKHLDAVKGAMDVEEFIEEHQDLADAIGYEFEEETTFRITLEVVVKHQMGKTDLDDALDIEVKEFNGYGDSGIIDIDVTDIDIRKQ